MCLQPIVYVFSRITYIVLLFRFVPLNEVTIHESQCFCSVNVLMCVTSLTPVGDTVVYFFRFFVTAYRKISCRLKVRE